MSKYEKTGKFLQKISKGERNSHVKPIMFEKLFISIDKLVILMKP